MKRLIVCIIAALLLFAACGRSAVQIPAQPETPATVEAPSGKTVVLPEYSTADLPTEESVGDLSAVYGPATTETAPASTAPHETTLPTTTEAPRTTVVPKTTAAPKTTEAPKTTAAPKTTEAPKTTAAPKTAVPATTVPVTTAPTTQPAAKTCTVRIECGTILDNLKKLKAGKAAFVPKSGVILEDTAVVLSEGDTAFTVLKRACEEHVCTDNCRYCQEGGIQIEYTFTPVFETYYIEGIHQLYEKDCGTMSGWMFSVNGKFPEEGASSTTVSAGDRIVFCYTCDMGDDVGNHFEG